MQLTTAPSEIRALVLAAEAAGGDVPAIATDRSGGGSGAAIVAEDFHSLILPLDRPSIFLNLTHGFEIHAGPLGGGEGNGLLLDALGDPTPVEAVVVPVRVRGKVVAFLGLDQGADAVAGISIPLVQEVARLAGLAIEILVLRQKVRAGARLTETVPSD